MAESAIHLQGFAESIRLFRVEAPAIIKEEELLLGASFAAETKRVALDFLDKMVYDLPEPTSYLRTGRTRRAIKARVFEAGPDLVAEAYIDPADFDFRYYLTLEYGTGNWYWWGYNHPASRVYHPRPFWKSTKAVMNERYRGMEHEMLRKISTRINGRFA